MPQKYFKEVSYMESIAKGCFSFKVQALNRQVSNIYNRYLAEAGITVTQFTILREIKHGYCTTIKEASITLYSDRTTLSRNIKNLEKMRLVELKPETQIDKRAKNWSITPLGEQILDIAIPRWEFAQDQIKSLLGKEEYNAADKMLHELILNLSIE